MKSKQETANRLIKEKSPYLLQHAYNPVDWYPWGDEAFDKARQEDKPVFLSIGYSTCHWCHVMERESFEDQEVADVLNEHFAAIKVDREERPDIDQIYMTVCQALTGHGGWPLTVIMTPEKKPFFAGTYFPKHSKMGHAGLTEILERIVELWREQRHDLLSTGDRLAEAVQQQSQPAGAGDIDREVARKAYRNFATSFDEVYGGFGTAPKFPTPHNLLFLMRYWKLSGEKGARKMAEKTLLAMAKGGIYDQIGFGFSRYSTDRKWLVPHFEKMLYDNALLANTYLEAYQSCNNKFFAEITREIFAYILRDMTSAEGGFYSAEDADSEGVEGKFYLWEPQEIKQVLGNEKGGKFCAEFDIAERGNFEGKSIPNLIDQEDKRLLELKHSFKEAGQELFSFREQRIHPFKDDKVLTSWNGLMIAALARGARVLDEGKYLEAALKAMDFIYARLFTREGRLMARYRDGEAAFPGYLDDYAFMVWGLLELYQSTFDSEYLARSLKLNQSMLDLFWDEQHGGLYLYGKDSEQLLAKPKEIYDGATPSGNSVAALNLLRLARLTGNYGLEEIAEQQLKAFAGHVNSYPAGYSFYLMAVLYHEHSQEIVIAGREDAEDTKAMINWIRRAYLPFADILLVKPDDHKLLETVPGAEDYKSKDGRTTAYVCRNFICQEPTTNVERLKKLLH